MYLETVRINRKDSGKYSDALVVQLSSDDVTDILQLQSEVIHSLDNKNIFVPIESWELDYIFSGGGFLYGLKDKEKLLAFAGLIKPGAREDNLGYDLLIPETELKNVAHLETSLVHPVVRGNNLQLILAGLLVKLAEKSEDIYYIANTVSPFNIPSILTTLKLGLKIRSIKEKYDGKLRCICCMDIKRRECIYSLVEMIHHTDIEMQIELTGKGYEGFSFRHSENGLFIEYGI